MVDNTDRNRTSPFAFTGNRFEFRAQFVVQLCNAAIVINTAVTEELKRFKAEVDALVNTGVKKDEAVLQIIRNYIIASKNIRFEGNGYSEEWIKEAAARGLRSANHVTQAFKEYLRPESVALFTDNHIFTPEELTARYEIKNEIFLKKVQIESRIIADMAANHIVPTAIKYKTFL